METRTKWLLGFTAVGLTLYFSRSRWIPLFNPKQQSIATAKKTVVDPKDVISEEKAKEYLKYYLAKKSEMDTSRFKKNGLETSLAILTALNKLIEDGGWKIIPDSSNADELTVVKKA